MVRKRYDFIIRYWTNDRRPRYVGSLVSAIDPIEALDEFKKRFSNVYIIQDVVQCNENGSGYEASWDVPYLKSNAEQVKIEFELNNGMEISLYD